MRNQRSVCLIAGFVFTLTGVFSLSAWAQPVPTTNLFVWLAADNVNGDDTNPADGAPVETWVDLSGNGNNFAVTTAEAPTYSTSAGPLGLPTVLFDGLNDGLGLYNKSYTSPQIYMVMKGAAGITGDVFEAPRVIGAGGGTYLLWGIDSTGGIIGAAREHEDANYRTLFMPTATPSVADYTVLTLWTNIYDGADHPGSPQWLSAHTLSVGQDVTTEGTQDYAYGTVGAPVEYAVTYPATADHYYDLVLGENIDYFAFANMSVAELLIYENPTGYPMSTEDRTAVETYLYNKYMAPPELPGDVNFDGLVNIFDINLVSANWNGGGPTGDANHDGTVNIFDINLISANWTPAGAATAVPEPGGVFLAALGCLGLVCAVRARVERKVMRGT